MKLCGWALEALNYLPREFWKSDRKHLAWTLQETLYFFDLSLSNFPTMYEDAFEKYLIEKAEYEEALLQDKIDRAVFQSFDVDRKEVESKEVTQKIEMKVERGSADDIDKSVMTKKPAKISSNKHWPAIKVVGFEAVRDEKTKVRDGRQRRTLRWNDNLSVVETAADSNYIGGNQKCDSNGEREDQNTTKPKPEDEHFKEKMDQNISLWDIGKKMTGAQLRSEALEETANRELEDDITFSDDNVSDNSFFNSDNEKNFDCMDDDVFLPNFPERHINSEPFNQTNRNELTTSKPCCKGLIACQYITSGHCLPYFGKWIFVGETCMPHLTSAKDFVPTLAAGGTLSSNWVATELHQESSSTESQTMDRIDVSLKSLGGKCEILEESFLTSPAYDAHRQATKSCENRAAKANADGTPEGSTEEKSTTPPNLGKNFFPRSGKKTQLTKQTTDKKKTRT